MATETQRRRKYLTRRAHAFRYDNRLRTRRVPQPVRGDAAWFGGTDSLTVSTLAVVDNVRASTDSRRCLLSDAPTRAKCPVCGFSQKVKRDGTMGRHDQDAGMAGPRACPGTGQPYGGVQA